jgi:hypothetical protein
MGARDSIVWDSPPGSDAVQQVLRRRLGVPDRLPEQAQSRFVFSEQADEVGPFETLRGVHDIAYFQLTPEDRGVVTSFLQQPIGGETRRRVFPLDSLDPRRSLRTVMRHS